MELVSYDNTRNMDQVFYVMKYVEIKMKKKIEGEKHLDINT